MQKITLQISGMMCGNCQQHVHDLLSEIDGVKHVEVSLEKEEARINFDAQVLKQSSFSSVFKDSNYAITSTV